VLGRLYRETFYVCRNCGRDGETIEKIIGPNAVTLMGGFAVREAMIFGWGAAAVLVPLFVWMGWRDGAIIIGGALLTAPGVIWWDNRRMARNLVTDLSPRAGAPGRVPIAEPTAGCDPGAVVGRCLPSDDVKVFRATGACCERADWIEAYRVKDEDRVPCRACGQGVMTVSEHAIH
jgi:hypothetical protein